MKLITEVNEEIKVLTEEDKGGKKQYFIEGIFMQAEQKNRNGRVYPKEILQKESERYSKEYVDKNRAYGELGHPEGPTINLERVSHMIKELKEDGNNFVGKAKIMDTPYGNIVKNLMSEGATLGVSTRGMGSLEERNGVKVVKDDFYLATAADIVADPSAPDAFVKGVMESKEWVWDNGIIKEVDVAKMKKAIEKAPKKLLPEEQVRIFNEFISKL
tara:strand:- start:1281 stop:1928 length:648 start_codon:yes stop_codon:yes gene_type:complete